MNNTKQEINNNKQDMNNNKQEINNKKHNIIIKYHNKQLFTRENILNCFHRCPSNTVNGVQNF